MENFIYNDIEKLIECNVYNDYLRVYLIKLVLEFCVKETNNKILLEKFKKCLEILG